MLRGWARDGFTLAAVAIAFVGLFSGLAALDDRAQHSYLVKAKLSKVLSTLDPIKSAIVTEYQHGRRVPRLNTVVTTANQGQHSPSDWAALGFTALPGLAREVSTLRVDTGGAIIVGLTGIDEDIDGTELRAIPVTQAESLLWTYECTSTDSRVRKYFRC